MQNADGDEVASFEITNGSITNDQTKPTFSSVAVVNGKLELTFSENIAVTGTLNKEDFTVTDSGTAVSISSVTISNGKILISKPAYSLGSTTPYDLSSSSSSLSGQTYSHSSRWDGNYTSSKAFDTNNNDGWVSVSNSYSSGTHNGSGSTGSYDGEWVQVDIGQSVLLTSYEFYPRIADDNGQPKNMRFFSSTNGTNWTQVQDWTGLTLADNWKPNGSYTSLGPYSTQTVGRYFRLAVNEVTTGNHTQMATIKLLGVIISEASVSSFTDTDVTIKYIKNSDSSKQLIRVNDPSDAVNSFTVTNGTDTTPAVSTPKDGILIDFDQNIASSSGYAAGNFAVTEGAVSKSVRGVKITSDNKVFLSMLTDINTISDTNITYTPSSTASENLETTLGDKTLGFTITNGSDVTTRTNDRLIVDFSESIVSKTTLSPNDFLIFENVTKTSTTTFSSVAAVSGKLELTFNNNVTVTGSLDKEDFTVTDSGTAVSISSVTISNGKILIASSYSLGSTTPYDLSSSSSSLSGQTYSHSSRWDASYTSSKAFDTHTNPDYGWASASNSYSSGTHNGSGSTGSYDGEWVQVDIGQSVLLTSYEFYPRVTDDNGQPKNMRFFSSANGTNWTQVQDWTGLTLADNWKPNGSYTSLGPYSTQTVGRYFRLAVNEVTSGNHTQMTTIKLLGVIISEASVQSFTDTNYVITYTKHATASRNIVKDGATTDAIDSFRIDNGSETGLVKNVAQVTVVGGDVQLKNPIKYDNQTSIDIAISNSTLTGSRSYSASSIWSSSYVVSNAFDGSISSSWASFNNSYTSAGEYINSGSAVTEGYKGEWIQVDVGTTVVLTSYEIKART